MIRRLAPWFGVLTLLLVAGILVGFGRSAVADPATAVLLAGLVFAAVLSIGGGSTDSIAIGPWTLPWNVLVGASQLVLALAIGLSSVLAAGTGGTDARIVTAALLVGAASLGWVGLQTIRDTRHVDLEASPSLPRLLGIVALAAGSAVVGTLVVAVV